MEVADRLQRVFVPCLPHLPDLAHDRLPAHVRPRLRPTLRGPHDDVWVVKLPHGFPVPRVVHLEGASHQLHVLQRHRLFLEAEGVETLVAIQIYAVAHDLPPRN
jgi:hypothetical protein